MFNNLQKYKLYSQYWHYYYLSRLVGINNTDDCFINSIDKYITKDSVVTFEDKNGFVTIEKNLFDSEILGFNCFKINYLFSKDPNNINQKLDLLSQVNNFCLKNNVNYILNRTLIADNKTIQALETDGYITTDALITFTRELDNLNSESFKHPDYEINLLEKQSNKYFVNLCELSKISFTEDRFHNDPLILKENADKIYYEWMLNSCRNTCENIIVAIDNQNDLPVGFVICKIETISNINIGTIVLIATDSNFRNKNIGYNMLIKSLEFFKDHNVEIVQVGTQLSNIPAQRLYLKLLFKPVYGSLTLRKYFKSETNE
ncbi:MAG: GNAT family N-acetyltransferase [Cyanobacteriota bacterium]